VSGERLTQEEVAVVLRRAAELDAAATSAARDDALPVELVEAGAAEVGLDPASVRQAVAELRAGMLTDDPPRRRTRPHLVAARIVAVEPAEAVRRTGVFLARQLLVKARDRDAVQVWRHREDVVARLLRTVDWRATYRLDVATEVIVRAVPATDGTLVRLDAPVGRGASWARRLVTGCVLVAGTAVTIATAAAGDAGWALAAAGGTAVIGAGGYASARAGLRRSERKALDALEGMLDELELPAGRDMRTMRALTRVRTVYRA
jgi:hypothetical protein